MKLNFFPSQSLESFSEIDAILRQPKTKTAFNTFRVYDEEEFQKNQIKALKRLINASKVK